MTRSHRSAGRSHRPAVRAAALAVITSVVALAAPALANAAPLTSSASAGAPAAQPKPAGEPAIGVGGNLAAPAPRAAAATQSTDIDKGNAAALLGIVAGPELLILSDHDFVAAMYRAADDLDKPHPLEPEHQTVRGRAIDAIIAGSAAETTYIKTGMATANTEDQQLVTDRREQQRKEREAKAKAAAQIGLTVTDADLDKTVYDFVVLLDLKADDHKDTAVKTTARTALQGSADDQWQFLTVGIIAAHASDVQRLIDEDTSRTEAEKAEAKAREARVTAAYYALGQSITTDDPLAKLPDQNFVKQVVKLAPHDTEVYNAALEALLSSDPADWTAYVNTGAHDAWQLDLNNDLKKRDNENITAITEIRTRAAKSLVHPDLVVAADAALAGKPADRARFLTKGQYDHLVQTIRTDGPIDADSYVADSAGDAALNPWTPGAHPETAWKVEAGLSDPSCFSFESTTRPNYFLHWRKSQSLAPNHVGGGDRAVTGVDPTDGSDLFRQESTWCVHLSAAGAHNIVISPVSASDGWLYLAGTDDDPSLSRPAVWAVDTPAVQTPFDRRYNEDKNLQTALGKPTADPVFDANNAGYRTYEKGRLYLTYDGARPHVAVVYSGPLLDKLLAFAATELLQGRLDDQEARAGGGQLIKLYRPLEGRYLYVVWRADTGAHAVYGMVGKAWADAGEVTALGYPLDDEQAAGTGGARVSHFTTGSVYWIPGRGTEVVGSLLNAKYAQTGYDSGPLGFPFFPAVWSTDHSVLAQRFDHGGLYYGGSGTHAVYGPIYDEYVSFGEADGQLGHPDTDVTDTTDGKGKYVFFSRNASAIYWSPATGAHAVYGLIRQKWSDLGAEKSFLGFPTGDEQALPNGRRSTFAGGRVDFSADGGTVVAYATVPVPFPAIQIRGVQTGRCLQVSGVGNDAQLDNRGTELWDCVPGAPKEIWDVVNLGANKYTLKNRNSGKCLDLAGSSVNNAADINQYTCNGTPAQQWEFTTGPTGSVALRNVGSAKIVEAADNQTANGARVQQWADLVHPNQLWTVVGV